MKRILEKAWLKTVAFLLCCVLLVCAVACGAGAIYAVEEKWYQEKVPFEDSDLCYWLVRSYLQKAYYGDWTPITAAVTAALFWTWRDTFWKIPGRRVPGVW